MTATDTPLRPPTRRWRGLLSVLAMLLLLAQPMAIVMFGTGHEALQLAQESAAWPRVPAEIVASHFGDSGRGSSMRLNIRYRYQASDKSHTGTRVYHAGLLTQSRGRALAARFPQGAQVEAHVNPADPREATLLTGPQPGAYAVFWIPVATWLALFAVLLALWLTRATAPRGVTAST